MTPEALLLPVFVLGLWTVVMLVWVLATRLPAMTKARIDAQQAQDTAKLRELLPPEVSRVANNYNHLFEQPTLFYAVAIAIAALGHQDSLHVTCAWAFVGLRIAHSLVQATVDIVMIRFSLFLASWVALVVMMVRETLALL